MEGDRGDETLADLERHTAPYARRRVFCCVGDFRAHRDLGIDQKILQGANGRANPPENRFWRSESGAAGLFSDRFGDFSHSGDRSRLSKRISACV